MGRQAGGVKNNSSSRSMVNDKRIGRNRQLAYEYERKGYVVEKNLHPNGAFFAMYNVGKQTHSVEEIEVGRIFAENGFSLTLDKEGTMIRFPDGRNLKIPSSDGTVEGYTHEIYVLRGKPDSRTVAEALKHTHKTFKTDDRYDIQSDVAITIAPNGSNYHRSTIDYGVVEFKRQRDDKETKAKPILYLHIDEGRRKIYYRQV